MIDKSRLTFLGGGGLQRLSEATVAVVGAGGGGSHIAQQLAHLALKDLFIIDPDRLEPSNVNRVVTTKYRHVGQLKAEILAQRLSGLGTRIHAISTKFEDSVARKAIERCDLVFGALDGFRTRDNLERICRAALVPYIDIGLQIVVAESGNVAAVGGQVACSVPGFPCLWCMEILTEARLAADRVEYAVGMPQQQVVSMNGLLASQAVTTGLALVTGYGGDFRPSPYIVYDGLCHELRAHGFLPAADECSHYSLEGAGWRYLLPPLKNVS